MTVVLEIVRAGICVTHAQARRLIKLGAVLINGTSVTTNDKLCVDNDIIRIKRSGKPDHVLLVGAWPKHTDSDWTKTDWTTV